MTRPNVLSAQFQTATLVLVHGALTDASVWHGVIQRLQASGQTVAAPALPMRSLAGDADYLAAYLEGVEGDLLLVGHSYAGAVISHPAVTATGRVRGLVFIAAFQPDEGETAGELNERFPGSGLTADNLDVRPGPSGDQDLTLRPNRFAEVYAADVEPALAAAMAVSQRPINPSALGEALPGPATWRDLPSWALVSTEDRSLPAATLRYMANRAGSHTVEVAAAHAVPVSHPDAVADLIHQAVESIRSAS